jgi:hypothetical protein
MRRRKMTTRAFVAVDIPAGVGGLGRARPRAEPFRGAQRRNAMLIGSR